jgi:hypothetical protein
MKNKILMILVAVVTLPMTMVGMEEDDGELSKICWLAKVPGHVWNTHLMSYLSNNKSDQDLIERMKKERSNKLVRSFPWSYAIACGNEHDVFVCNEKDASIKFRKEKSYIAHFSFLNEQEKDFILVWSCNARFWLQSFAEANNFNIYDMKTKNKVKELFLDQCGLSQGSWVYEAISSDGSMIALSTTNFHTPVITVLQINGNDTPVTKMAEFILPGRQQVKEVIFNAQSTHFFVLNDKKEITSYPIPGAIEKPIETLQAYFKRRGVCKEFSQKQ